jgi:23S rRNA (pseudouridine1915-N3)-methyltransferase
MARRSVNEILIIWVGRRAPAALEELAAEYAKRVSRHVAVAEVRVRPAAGRQGDAGRALAHEADAVRKHLRPRDTVVVMDERGRERTTEELAAWLSRQLNLARTVFVIGSDLGVDLSLKKQAGELFSLSRLTLPHALARVLLLEQLYRASDLLAGGQYHRGPSG